MGDKHPNDPFEALKPHLCTRVICEHCQFRYVAVVPVGTIGRECPKCKIYDPLYQWEDMPENITPSA